MPVLLVLVCVMIHVGSHPVFEFHWNIIQLMFEYWQQLTRALSLCWGAGESKCWAGVYQVTAGWSARSVRGAELFKEAGWSPEEVCTSKMALSGHPGDEKCLLSSTLVIVWTTRPSTWLRFASITWCYKVLVMLRCKNTTGAPSLGFSLCSKDLCLPSSVRKH